MWVFKNEKFENGLSDYELGVKCEGYCTEAYVICLSQCDNDQICASNCARDNADCSQGQCLSNSA